MDPPKALQRQIFPWVEEAEERVTQVRRVSRPLTTVLRCDEWVRPVILRRMFAALHLEP